MKNKVVYVLTIVVMYIIVRSLIKYVVDGMWLDRSLWVQTVIEGFGVGIVLLIFTKRRGGRDDRMPN